MSKKPLLAISSLWFANFLGLFHSKKNMRVYLQLPAAGIKSCKILDDSECMENLPIFIPWSHLRETRKIRTLPQILIQHILLLLISEYSIIWKSTGELLLMVHLYYTVSWQQSTNCILDFLLKLKKTKLWMDDMLDKRMDFPNLLKTKNVKYMCNNLIAYP